MMKHRVALLVLVLVTGMLACTPEAPPSEPKLVPPYPGAAGKWAAPNDYGAPTSNAPKCPPLAEGTASLDDGGGRAIACKVVDDCWVDDAKKPIARPTHARGQRPGYCDAAACHDGFCVVLHR